MSRVADDQKGERIGVLGGTFDPVHLGHLAVAERAYSVLSLDRILFIPAARPPHKPDLKITSFVHRSSMLELALKDRPEFVCSTMEEKRSGPSFSVDTLSELRAELDEKGKIFFLIGMDAFTEISSWKDYRRLPELCDLVVIDRHGCSMEFFEQIIPGFGSYVFSAEEKCWICPDTPGRIHSMMMEPVAISSTKIREMIAEGETVASLVPPPVAEYIATHSLFM